LLGYSINTKKTKRDGGKREREGMIKERKKEKK
jgi:hypothetical protein